MPWYDTFTILFISFFAPLTLRRTSYHQGKSRFDLTIFCKRVAGADCTSQGKARVIESLPRLECKAGAYGSKRRTKVVAPGFYTCSESIRAMGAIKHVGDAFPGCCPDCFVERAHAFWLKGRGVSMVLKASVGTHAFRTIFLIMI